CPARRRARRCEVSALDEATPIGTLRADLGALALAIRARAFHQTNRVVVAARPDGRVYAIPAKQERAQQIVAARPNWIVGTFGARDPAESIVEQLAAHAAKGGRRAAA